MEGKTDGISTGRRNEPYIVAGNIVIFERFPELSGEVGTDQFAEHLVDASRRICLVEAKHIPFRVQPVAKVRPFDKELLPFGGNQVGAGDTHECFRRQVGRIRICSAGVLPASGNGYQQEHEH